MFNSKPIGFKSVCIISILFLISMPQNIEDIIEGVPKHWSRRVVEPLHGGISCKLCSQMLDLPKSLSKPLLSSDIFGRKSYPFTGARTATASYTSLVRQISEGPRYRAFLAQFKDSLRFKRGSAARSLLHVHVYICIRAFPGRQSLSPWHFNRPGTHCLPHGIPPWLWSQALRKPVMIHPYRGYCQLP